MAAGKTYEPISTTTVSGTPTSVSLSPPSTYTDLKIVIWHSTAFMDNLNARFNSDTAANYRFQAFTAAYSAMTGPTTYIEFNFGDDVNSYYDIDILNYNSTAYRGVQSRNVGQGNYPCVTTGLWLNTSAITNILLRIGASGVQTFPNGTIITLFGIKAA